LNVTPLSDSRFSDGCGTCGYRIEAETGDLRAPIRLHCGRFPPQVVALPVQTLQGSTFAPAVTFPMVDKAQICGEWKRCELPLVSARVMTTDQ